MGARGLQVGTGTGDFLRPATSLQFSQLGALVRHPRLGHRDSVSVGFGVEAGEQLSGNNPAAFVHRQFDDLALDHEGKIDLTNVDIAIQNKVTVRLEGATIPPPTTSEGGSDQRKQEETLGGHGAINLLPARAKASFGAFGQLQSGMLLLVGCAKVGGD